MIRIDESARARVEVLRTERGAPGLFLRVSVDGGGCAGFQYSMALEESPGPDDVVFDGCVVTDPVSLEFLKDSEVFFDQALAGSKFRIENPNARSGCGCGASFSV